MSVQFGKCNFDGRPVDPKDLDEARPVLVPYGPDGEGFICKDNVLILYRALHTTKESRRERQPVTLASGAILTWDGRLDNRDELIGLMAKGLSHDSTDLEIVAAAYQAWACGSFAKLIGDWAISVWNPKNQSLILAKDFVGTRHLYYRLEKDQVAWCTILDPLVQRARRSLHLEEEYLAGWLSSFPDTHLTPYAGIHAVRPSSFVRLSLGVHETREYWSFEPRNEIRYRTDAEYEEHFGTVFSHSVRRRLRSDLPVLAELSGGMDSSSVVCCADALIAGGQAEAPRLDTVSYYDDSEPNWNERLYFTKVEEKRGRTGCHIDASGEQFLDFGSAANQFWVTPASMLQVGPIAKQLAECMNAQRNRVLLSGIGGDEFTGGVSNPVPALADLIATGKIAAMARELKAWALWKRKPWLQLLSEVIRQFLPPDFNHAAGLSQPHAWLEKDFARRHRRALLDYRGRLKLFGPSPRFQENMATLEVLRRQLACLPLISTAPHETAYTYLDRDLLAFLFSVPHRQLARPGERRRMMRRALAGIVPAEILNRRRKASVARTPMLALANGFRDLLAGDGNLRVAMLGIIDADVLLSSVRSAQIGRSVPVVPLMRILQVECWLRHLEAGLAIQIGRAQPQLRGVSRWLMPAA